MYVFVYGTLKKNCPNHYVLESRDNGKADFVCEARTEDLFPLVLKTKYDIPFLLDQTGIGNVKIDCNSSTSAPLAMLILFFNSCLQHVLGEVYSVDEKMLAKLDKFEGNPTIYRRRLGVVKPTDASKEALSTWLYTFHSFKETLLQETFHDSYKCTNYDLLRSVSGTSTAEERADFFKELR